MRRKGFVRGAGSSGSAPPVAKAARRHAAGREGGSGPTGPVPAGSVSGSGSEEIQLPVPGGSGKDSEPASGGSVQSSRVGSPQMVPGADTPLVETHSPESKKDSPEKPISVSSGDKLPTPPDADAAGEAEGEVDDADL